MHYITKLFKDMFDVIRWQLAVTAWELTQCPVPPTGRRGGQQGQFAPGPQCKGAPKQCRTCSNKIRSSVTFQPSFFKGVVLLCFRLKSTCSFALCFMLLTQIMHNYLNCVATAQSASYGMNSSRCTSYFSI